MPSPIAHLTAGYIAYGVARLTRPQEKTETRHTAREVLFTSVAFSNLPDIDSIAGIVVGDFGRFHNNFTHSILVGAGISVAFAGVMAWRRHGFVFWLLLAAACYSLHVLMDAATLGRGVMALWPITGNRFQVPVPLFYGFHWSDGWVNPRHLWTLVTELTFAALTLGLWFFWSGRMRVRR